MADLFNKLFNPSNNAKTLLVLNTAGMIFAALSNTFAAATDKNTSAEDKKFLVPAGLVTGVANIGVYFAITKKWIDGLQGAVKLNKDGSVKKTVKGVADLYLDRLSPETLKKNAGEFVEKTIKKAQKGSLFGIGKKSKEYVDSMKANFYAGDTKEITQEAINLYKNNVKGGLGVVGAFAGAIVGCAIITPIIRDVSAYIVQKQMEKQNPQLQDKPYRPYFDPAHLKTGLGLKEGYKQYNKQPLSMKNYMTFTNGRTRI